MINENLNKEKNFLSVVAYVRNNESSIKEFLSNIDNVLSNRFKTYEFVLVNDASEDNSVKLIEELADSIEGNVTVINLAWKHGLEASMLAGLDIAIGDFVIEFDSLLVDYEYELISKLYFKCLEGYDIVAASSKSDVKVSSSLFYKFLNSVSHRKMELRSESFRIISRRALNRVMRSREKLRYRKALYHYSGFNTTILSYEPNKKVVRNDDITVGEKVKLATDVLVSFSDFGMQSAVFFSALFFVVAIGMMTYTVYSYLTVEGIQPGWTTTMLFLSASFSAVFFVLTILAKYLTALLLEVQKKPSYVYKSVDRLSRK